MLALLSYTHYAQARLRAEGPKSSAGSAGSVPDSRLSTFNYFLALFFFACGLMSKSMVVTLPFVLLLLDFWPLERFNTATLQGLLLEKIPFFALALAGSIVTYLVQKTGGAVSNDPLSFRVANMLWAYMCYISKIFWPADLAVVYPFPGRGLAGLAVVAALLLAMCSIAFILLARRRPYFFVGWFWFLGMLVPAIGIVQVGSASMADRYTYLPGIGLFILVVWGLSDFFGSQPRRQKILALGGIVALAGCLAVSSIQLKYWRNSITLFSHACAVTKDNYVACTGLGQALDAVGMENQALTYCAEAVRLNPDYPPGQFILGMVLWKKGEPDEAMGHLNAAAQAAPRNPGLQCDLGNFLLEHGLPEKAASRFTAALNDDPDFADAHNALGKILFKQGKGRLAAGQLSQAVALEPDNPQFRYDYGTFLIANSNLDEAVAQLSEAARLKPDFADAQDNLAVAFVEQGKMAEAIAHFSKVVELQPASPTARFNLGLAFLNHQQPAEAAAQFSRELRLAPNETQAHYRLAQALQQQNKTAEAVFHYRQALRLTPDFSEAKNELDKILAAHPELKNSGSDSF